MGIFIAATIGPIGVLCIRRTLQFGRASGLVSGLGVATAHGVFAIIAAFSLTLIINFLIEWLPWFKILSGTFLIFIGTTTFFAKIGAQDCKVSQMTLLNSFVSIFFLTLINPMTILLIIAVFSSAGFTLTNGLLFSTISIIGIYLGSATWYIILITAVSLFRDILNKTVLKWTNRIAGLIIASFGMVSLISSLIWLLPGG